MCGIVGYIGKQEAAPLLLDGLRRLEYRGYDSSGMAVLDAGEIGLRKRVGRIANLAELLREKPVRGRMGVSHTRWAALVLVHNGVIENHSGLREAMQREGHRFLSQTDTEVLAHLVGKQLSAAAGGEPVTARLLVDAVRGALQQVVGTYGIAVLHRDVPGVLVGARRGSPLVLGIGKGEHFLASDVGAIANYTREVVYLKDFDLVSVQADGFEIHTLPGGSSGYEISSVDFKPQDMTMGEYPHFMLKEIFEQPDTITDAMRGRLSREEATAKLGGLNMSNAELRSVERVVLTGCGTAFHAAMVGEHLIEQLAHIPSEVEFASEFRYRNMPMPTDVLVFALSQSGETADTLAALRESQRKGHRTLGICNNVASTIARESDGGVYMHAGPEIGVAATKSFTSQCAVLTLVALLMGRIRNLSSTQGLKMLDELEALPEKIRAVLRLSDQIRSIALKYCNSKAMMFLGRQYNYPVALEGALKMKEVSYIHASGHPSAELKHGVIALITPEVPSVFVAPEDGVLEKNLSNIEEVRARKGPVIGIGTEGCRRLEQICDDTILIPHCPDYLAPILNAVPLQLLAYHTAVALGCDVDKPRNLAKSVTVE
ncbi:MAG: glutamine--fructose-6-phosphate transaminase (isomerizing) [Verrucomicrobia bacterium]|nr:glutamine--fructose-6-phosphate transaminase (isomerizing) [Verrucomicrobiota bacterium]